MATRTVTVGDDLTLPAPVKVADTNLPARLQDTALNATYVPREELPPATFDGGNATSTYTGTFNFDGGSAA
jgi:hypothetical protein